MHQFLHKLLNLWGGFVNYVTADLVIFGSGQLSFDQTLQHKIAMHKTFSDRIYGRPLIRIKTEPPKTFKLLHSRN